MEVTLYKVSKKITDVRKPFESDSFRVLLNVFLKSESNVLEPVIEIQNFDPTEYNYAYIPSFGRYYWINNWSYRETVWTASLYVDVLASYKEEIEQSTQYVVRSQNEYTSTLTDTMYPATNELSAASRTSYDGNLWDPTLMDGRFIVGLVGKGSYFDTLSSGLVNYFSMDADAFYNFRSAVYDDSLAFFKKTGSFGDLPTELVKLFVDVNEYVVSCIYVPYDPVGSSVNEVTIGFWTWTPPTDSVVKQISLNSLYTFTKNVYVPKHPNYPAYGFYLNGSGFSSYNLTVPGVGVLTLDATAMMRANAVRVTLKGDAYSGAGKCRVQAVIGDTETSSTLIELYDIPINIGVPIQLSSNENSTGGLINGALNTVSAVANKDVMGALGGAVDTFSAVPSAGTHVIGSQGTFASLREILTIRAIFNKPADRDLAVFGRPCCRAIQLAALGIGYCQCANAHVDIAKAYRAELLEIEQFLNSGVYLFA